MDEKHLEDILNQLKKKYDEMPSISNTETIINSIKKEKKQLKRRFRISYVASFIGVGIIAGILLSHGMNQWEKQPIPPNIKQATLKIKATGLVNYYLDQEKRLIESLTLSPSASPVFPEVYNYVNDVEDQLRINNYSNDEEKRIILETVTYIDENLLPPSQLMTEIQERNHSMNDDEFHHYLKKQNQYLSLFKREFHRFENEVNELTEKYPITTVLSFLTNGDPLVIKLEGLSTAVQENGYKFIYNRQLNKIDIDIDYQKIVLSLKGKLTDSMKKYLNLKDKTDLVQNFEMVGSWMDLGNRIMELEDAIVATKSKWMLDELTKQYVEYYVVFLKGVKNTPLYDSKRKLKEDVKKAYEYVMVHYPSNQTTDFISQQYLFLENNNFTVNDGLNLLIPPFPSFIELHLKEGNFKLEEVASSDQSIFELSDHLLNVYNQFSKSKDIKLLSRYNHFEIVKLYLHAYLMNDYETVYYLFDSKERPEYEDFIENFQKSREEIMTLVDDYQYAQIIGDIHNPNGIELFFSNQAPIIFQLKNDNGIWKILYTFY